MRDSPSDAFDASVSFASSGPTSRRAVPKQSRRPRSAFSSSPRGTRTRTYPGSSKSAYSSRGAVCQARAALSNASESSESSTSSAFATPRASVFSTLETLETLSKKKGAPSRSSSSFVSSDTSSSLEPSRRGGIVRIVAKDTSASSASDALAESSSRAPAVSFFFSSSRAAASGAAAARLANSDAEMLSPANSDAEMLALASSPSSSPMGVANVSSVPTLSASSSRWMRRRELGSACASFPAASFANASSSAIAACARSTSDPKRPRLGRGTAGGDAGPNVSFETSRADPGSSRFKLASASSLFPDAEASSLRSASSFSSCAARIKPSTSSTSAASDFSNAFARRNRSMFCSSDTCSGVIAPARAPPSGAHCAGDHPKKKRTRTLRRNR